MQIANTGSYMKKKLKQYNAMAITHAGKCLDFGFFIKD